MEIKLNIDGGDFSKEVKDLISSLSKEEKLAMSKEVMVRALADSESRMNKNIAKDRAFKEFMKDKAGGDFCLDIDKNGDKVLKQKSCYNSGWDTYVDPRYGDKFDALVDKYSDVSDFFRQVILEQMVKNANELVVEAVKGNEKISTAIDTALKEVVAKIPEMVQNAMQKMFLEMMTNSVSRANEALDFTGNVSGQVQQIEETLRNKGIY